MICSAEEKVEVNLLIPLVFTDIFDDQQSCGAVFFSFFFSHHFLSAPSAGRASLHGKASLQIDPVRSEDQGWYECRVLMLEQQYDTFHNGSWVHLTVNGESPAHGARRLCSLLFF